MELLAAITAFMRASPLFTALTVLVLIDVIYAAVRMILRKQPERPLLDLIAEKFTILVVVVTALTVEKITTNPGIPLTESVMLFYCAVEALQILQSAVQGGLPAPPQLKVVLDGVVGSMGVLPGVSSGKQAEPVAVEDVPAEPPAKPARRRPPVQEK